MHLAFRHPEYGSYAINSFTPSTMDEHEATGLLRLLEEAKAQLSQERQRREEADRQREEANRQREEADRQREEADR